MPEAGRDVGPVLSPPCAAGKSLGTNSRGLLTWPFGEVETVVTLGQARVILIAGLVMRGAWVRVSAPGYRSFACEIGLA